MITVTLVNSLNRSVLQHHLVAISAHVTHGPNSHSAIFLQYSYLKKKLNAFNIFIYCFVVSQNAVLQIHKFAVLLFVRCTHQTSVFFHFPFLLELRLHHISTPYLQCVRKTLDLVTYISNNTVSRYANSLYTQMHKCTLWI